MLLNLTEPSIKQNKKGSKWFGLTEKYRSGLHMLYDFKNIETGEIKEYTMRLAEYDDFVANNPGLVRVIVRPPRTVAGHGDFISRTDGGWKEVQDKMKAGLPPKYKDNIRQK